MYAVKNKQGNVVLFEHEPVRYRDGWMASGNNMTLSHSANLFPELAYESDPMKVGVLTATEIAISNIVGHNWHDVCEKFHEYIDTKYGEHGWVLDTGSDYDVIMKVMDDLIKEVKHE